MVLIFLEFTALRMHFAVLPKLAEALHEGLSDKNKRDNYNSSRAESTTPVARTRGSLTADPDSGEMSVALVTA